MGYMISQNIQMAISRTSLRRAFTKLHKSLHIDEFINSILTQKTIIYKDIAIIMASFVG